MSQKQTPLKLNTFQGISIVANTMLGAGLLTLPRALTTKANTPDGWITLILEGFIFIFFIYLNTLIQKNINTLHSLIICKKGWGNGSAA